MKTMALTQIFTSILEQLLLLLVKIIEITCSHETCNYSAIRRRHS